MQAITNDIVVSQTAGTQVAALQLSQNINNPQTNSLISFKDIVASFSNDFEKTADVEKESQPIESAEAEFVSKQSDEKVENYEEAATESTKDVSEENKIQKNDENSKSVKLEKKTDEKIISTNKIESKNESGNKISTVKNQEDKNKIDSNTAKKMENSKKIKSASEKLDQMIEESKIVPEENLEFAAETTVKPENIKLEKTERGEQDLTINNDLQVSTEINSFEETAIHEDYTNVRKSSEKISTLDKDGKIVVKDFRTEVSEKDSDKEIKPTTEIKIESKDTATVTVNLEPQISEENVLSLNNQTAASDGSNFQAMLNNQIQNSAPEFVKAGSIILKDNNQGTINLVLHPDDLGNVKIHLTMDGKSLSAQITVATKEAMEVFKDNAETLREAFIKSGFDVGNFEVAYNNSSSNQNSDFNDNFQQDTFIANKLYRSETGEGIAINSEFDETNEIFSNYSINIVA